MKLVLSSLLLASLCDISSWSVSSMDMIVLTQSPDVNVTVGDDVNISCCYTEWSERLSFIWQKKQETEIHSHPIDMTSQAAINDFTNCSTLTFSSITRNDSGRYICTVRVLIPRYAVYSGNGTLVTVLDSEVTDEHPGNPTLSHSITAVAVMAVLLLITLSCACALRLRQGSAQVARVIYEVPHTDSDVAEMDKHSTSSSTGSTQWCQVLVYESCDYFERVQTKETG